MTPAQLADFDAYLNRWETRIRRSWRRLDARRAMPISDPVQVAMREDDPLNGLGARKPGLSDYDAHVESRRF